jgi:hypothetical protein
MKSNPTVWDHLLMLLTQYQEPVDAKTVTKYFPVTRAARHSPIYNPGLHLCNPVKTKEKYVMNRSRSIKKMETK